MFADILKRSSISNTRAMSANATLSNAAVEAPNAHLPPTPTLGRIDTLHSTRSAV